MKYIKLINKEGLYDVPVLLLMAGACPQRNLRRRAGASEKPWTLRRTQKKMKKRKTMRTGS